MYVGAMAAETFRRHLTAADPARAVVFTGDRAKVQRDAVAMGVRVLVVTGGLPVDAGGGRGGAGAGRVAIEQPARHGRQHPAGTALHPGAASRRCRRADRGPR